MQEIINIRKKTLENRVKRHKTGSHKRQTHLFPKINDTDINIIPQQVIKAKKKSLSENLTSANLVDHPNKIEYTKSIQNSSKLPRKSNLITQRISKFINKSEIEKLNSNDLNSQKSNDLEHKLSNKINFDEKEGLNNNNNNYSNQISQDKNLMKINSSTSDAMKSIANARQAVGFALNLLPKH